MQNVNPSTVIRKDGNICINLKRYYILEENLKKMEKMNKKVEKK